MTNSFPDILKVRNTEVSPPKLPLMNYTEPISTALPWQAVIKNADMAEDMQQDAIDCATQALEKYNIEMLGGWR